MGLMDVIPGWKYVSAGVGVVVLLLAGWWFVKIMFPPSDLHEVEEEALEKACADLTAQIQKHLAGIDRGHLTIAVADVRGDTTHEQVRETIEKHLGRQSPFNVKDNDMLDDIEDAVGDWLKGGSLPSAEQILNQQGELDAVLFVSLDAKRAGAKEANVRLGSGLYEWVLDKDGKRLSIAKTSFVASGSTATGEGGAEPAGGFWHELGSALWRILVSAIGVFAIPFLFLPLTDWVSKKGSNLLGFVYLGVVTLIAMIPCYAVILGDPQASTTLGIVFSIFLLGVAGLWTFRMHDAWTDRL
ncbi:MAG: hypothetical protein L6Q71_00915 [Planctomycetes bacterium]|nr:hypothetical protein [Planctomycetota bacterium]NUQ34057.1 hypothetical protein [Planctomycetaceae bacterium]